MVLPIRTLLFTLLLLAASQLPLAGQTLPVGDPLESYLRLNPLLNEAGTTPAWVIRPVGLNPVRNLEREGRRAIHPWMDHPWFHQRGERSFISYGIYSPAMQTTWNSSYPFGQNDGALWQGRGLNSMFSVGGEVAIGPLEIKLRPEIGYSQNLGFELSPVATRVQPFGAPFPHAHNTDTPQRFGDESVTWFHPGQSTIQLQHWGIAAGISTANIWFGPSMNNPLTLSNNAPGFFHGFIGTTRPVMTPIGGFEGKVFWGGIQESDYYDTNPSNNLGFATGVLMAWSPSFIPGLTVGVIRTQYEDYPDSGLDKSLMTRVFSLDLAGRTDFDDYSEFITLLGRWSLPDYGLETWFEWGLNDGRPQSRMIPVILEHSRAYNLGLLKRFILPGNRWLALQMEMTQLEHDRTHLSFSAAQGTWYEHYRRTQGWTHLGQLMGAGIGVGSNNQLIRLDLYDRWGSAGLSVNRVELHNDKLRRNFSAVTAVQPEGEDPTITELQNTEFRFGVHTVLFLPSNLELQGDVIQARQLNRYNVHGNHTWNTNVSLTVRYNLMGGLR